ncbi:MAG: oxidoreductase [Bradyrhizobium sp.]
MGDRILIAGASGLIGGLVLGRMGETAITLGRRRLDSIPNEQLVGAVETWPDLIVAARPTTVICALGTTQRSAGSREAFRAIDHDAILAVATAAKNAGAGRLLLVSSVGASSRSPVFYLRTKGETEDAVIALKFERLDIFRPGLLTGSRREHRPSEQLTIRLSPLTDALTPSFLDRYRSIAARDVANAMVASLAATGHGIYIHHNREMLRLARG